MRRSQIGALAIALLAAFCQTADADPQPHFAVYLAQNQQPIGVPILTDVDVVEYCWSRQWLRLTESAASNWNAAMKEHRSPAGKPFVVLVDGAVCYSGTVWSMVFSVSAPPGPIVWDMALNGVLMIAVSNVPPNSSSDPRYDARVQAAFESLGKLKTECAENWWQ